MAKKDNAGAIVMLRGAVAIQDTLKYGEPPDWFFPVRESLGAVLLINGDTAEAEKAFRRIWTAIRAIRVHCSGCTRL